MLGEVPRMQAGYADITLAGMMLERVGGMPWEELMHRELFLPLGILLALAPQPAVMAPCRAPLHGGIPHPRRSDVRCW